MQKYLKEKLNMDEEKRKEKFLKEKSLKISIAEGSAYSVMDGFGLKYISPYAIALNLSNTAIGLLSSLPGLVGSLAQLPGSRAIEHYPRKKIVLKSVLLQAFMWLPIILVGILYFLFHWNVFSVSVLLIAFYTALVSFGAFAGPAWSSWMKDLITSNTDYYFGKRNGIIGAVGLASLLAAGLTLQYFEKSNVLLGFSLIFLMAFLGRVLSAYFFKKKYEPKISLQPDYYFNIFQFTKKMGKNNFGKFVIFSSIITFATAVASPFFAVYMLKDLNFNYLSYTIVTVASVASMLLFMPLWGKFGDKYGNVKTMHLTGALVFTIPLLWLATVLIKGHFNLIFYLIVVEIFSGFIWAGFNLSSGTFIFHAVSRERLGLCIAYNGVFSALGAFLGAFLGGEISSAAFPILGLQPILFVFLLSSSLRLMSVAIFIPLIKEVRKVEKFEIKLKRIFLHLLPHQMLQNIGIKRTGFNGPSPH